MNTQEKIRWFQEKIFSWYARHGRNLPWRRTRDPYAIAVSELMLQQTQVDRVIEHFPRWLARFPTWQKLARATQRSVVTQWSGMGYNRRAKNLHQLAKVILKKYGGVLPTEVEELEKLPGIGPYTARALAAFVGNKRQATLDVNIVRVLHRVFYGSELPQQKVSTRALFPFAQKIYPTRKRSHQLWNHALMDFGALVCTARNPQCASCPLAQQCKARPIIHARIREFYKTKEKSREPGITENGKFIPNRIFRGRIIEYLRMHRNVGMTTLGSAIKKDYQHRDEMWLRALIAQLIKDGMVTLRHTQKREYISLR